MPLPGNGLHWPPRALHGITSKYVEWDAWYVGDPTALASVYHATTRGTVAFDRVSQYRGGVVGTAARFWWGKPRGRLDVEDPDKLHIPLAGDICQASADLLYAEPPAITVTGDKIGQDLVDAAVEAGLLDTMAAGAETAAAFGDVYHRVTWDDTFQDTSFITTVHADSAWPEFRWGRLVAVTFWWDLPIEGSDQSVWRHLERHELDQAGNGVVRHGLYQGTVDSLGVAVPLTEHKATSGLAQQVDADGAIHTKSPGLAVVRVPNRTPQRRWRRHPVGAHLGRSDLDTLEPLFDKLDFTYSSWMRDIRLAKSRIIVPEFMLQTAGPGAGAWFDTDQDVYTAVNAPPREDGASQITAQQFTIRVDEHLRTCQELIENILRTAGYSAATFGEAEDGGSATATEVNARDRRSNLTRDRKIRAAKPALSQMVRKKLAVDRFVFNKPVDLDAVVVVDFPETSQDTPESLARTSETLFRAQAASVETRVRLMHPDWGDTEVTEEAAAIMREFSVEVPDPMPMPGGPE